MSVTRLVSPYGRTLVDLLVPGDEADNLRRRAAELPVLRLSERALLDLELIATGAFSPLTTFLGKADYDSVLERMRLADGTLWPIPVTLPASDDVPLRDGMRYALRSPKNDVIGVLELQEVYDWSSEREARHVFGRYDARHPVVAEMSGWGRRYVSGALRVLALPVYHDFTELRLTPTQVRAALDTRGASDVVAFQTRNPLHRSHEEMTRRAADERNAMLLIHPAVGLTRPGDVDHYTRVRSYRALVQRYYDPRRTLLALIPLAMRLAGPREALWHAIIRRNYGATHFIVGRDHAGPGPDASGRPFFGPYDAQEIVAAHEAEIGVRMVRFAEMVYLPDEDRYEEVTRVPPGVRTLSLSGSDVRERLARGEPLPPWFTRAETAAMLGEMYPPRQRQGFCVWLTGLTAAGKSAVADALTVKLMEHGRKVTLLDGDVVRTHLSSGLGFSREDRDTNVRRIGFVASEVVRHGGAAICAAVSPYRAAREECRALVGADRFVEVFVDTPVDVCEARDTKGLYARVRRGELKGLAGVDDPYERPTDPEVRLDGTRPIEESVTAIVRFLGDRRFVAEPGAA